MEGPCLGTEPAHFLKKHKPNQQFHRWWVKDKRGCPRELFRIWDGAGGNGPCSTQPCQPRLPFNPTKLPDLTPKPSQLCKLLPSFTQSFGCPPIFKDNQGSHPKNSARTLTLKKKTQTIYKQQKKLRQGLLLKSASSQNLVWTFQGSGDDNPNANVSFEGQRDKISTYSSPGWFLSHSQLCSLDEHRKVLIWKRIMWLVSGSLRGWNRENLVLHIFPEPVGILAE